MNKVHVFFLISILSFFTFAHAESKTSIDLVIDKLQFQKPKKGVGAAGNLIFKSANVNNNGIVLNINNVNNLFDSQIFIRPIFLGFTTQFGSYGVTLDEKSSLHTVEYTELQNSQFVLDDNQLNLSGESLHFISADASVKLNRFRLYCQSLSLITSSLEDNKSDNTANDMFASCFSFLTLNGSFLPSNHLADLEYEGVDKITGDKTFLQTKVSSLDLRKTQINANFINTKYVTNDSYFINANEVNFNCAKDENLKELDFEKIKKPCLNQFKLGPTKATLIDKSAKSSFNLDIKDVTVADKILYFTLNNGALSDASSTTSINKLLLNCKKETETDLLDLMQVLRDCISYSRISIEEINSTKPDEKKGSSIKKLAISSSNNALIIQAQTKFLGLTAHVSIYGKVALDEARRQLIITVTDTKLPLGINSVKLLIYFLKKNLISKDIIISNNTISISL